MRTLYASLILATGLLLSGNAMAAQPSADAIRAKEAPQYLRVAQRLAGKGDVTGALKFYNQVLAVDINNVVALAGVADLLLASASPTDAVPYFQKLQQLRPEEHRFTAGIATGYNRADRPRDALTALDSAIAAGISGPAILTERGLALDLMGRFPEAQRAYGDALKLDPKSNEILQRLAYSFAISGQYPTALSLLSQVADNPGGMQQVRNALATVYALSGQADQAMAIAGTGTKMVDAETAARRPYYVALSRLDPVARARAVHIGVLPSTVGALPTEIAPVAPPPPAMVTVPAAAAVPPAARPAKGTKPGRPKMVALPASEDNIGTAETSAEPTPAASRSASASPLPAADRIWVQLAISDKRAKLEKHWADASTRADLASLAPYVQTTALNGRPALRLIVGGYADQSTALALAKRLRASGIASFVNRNGLAADPLYP
jgi:Flp pilus assembly protein TadD